ncbi:HEAT repeat domain-containing protein [Planctomycetota bacterium]
MSILTAPFRLVFRYIKKQYLFSRIQSRNYDRRFEAVYALEDQFGPAAAPGLIYLLQHKDPEVRNDIAYTLELITGKYNGDNQKKWQAWWKKNKERVQKKYYS